MTDPEDEITFADPVIRIGYEAALGRFILAYNEVDYRLSQLIRTELSQRGLEDLAKSASTGTFTQRLQTLDILRGTAVHTMLAGLPMERLRSLNTDRNNLAHGHFDQNPFDGSYMIVLAKKARDYPTSHIAELATELAQIADSLRIAELLYDFKNLDEPDGT